MSALLCLGHAVHPQYLLREGARISQGAANCEWKTTFCENIYKNSTAITVTAYRDGPQVKFCGGAAKSLHTALEVFFFFFSSISIYSSI